MLILTNLADINECNTELHPCHLNATCINTNGSFHCLCNNGFTGDGIDCTGNRLLLHKLTLMISMVNL